MTILIVVLVIEAQTCCVWYCRVFCQGIVAWVPGLRRSCLFDRQKKSRVLCQCLEIAKKLLAVYNTYSVKYIFNLQENEYGQHVGLLICKLLQRACDEVIYVPAINHWTG